MTDIAPLVFVDCETTSLDRRTRRPWEIALIRRDPDYRLGEDIAVMQIRDVDLTDADPKALEIGRFHQRHLQHRPADSDDLEVDWLLTERDAAVMVQRLTHGAHLVGNVPDFDATTLDALLHRHGLVASWHYHLIDVEVLAVGWLAARARVDHGEAKRLRALITPPYKSIELSRACDVEPPGEADLHTALGDARWARRWYDRIMPPAAPGSAS